MTTTQETLACLKGNHKVLKELISCINQTGGLIPDPENPSLLVPNGDENWLDLAVCSENALHQCKEIESVLDAAGHPIPQQEKCPELKNPRNRKVRKNTRTKPRRTGERCPFSRPTP
jgi:hypothetical protein